MPPTWEPLELCRHRSSASVAVRVPMGKFHHGWSNMMEGRREETGSAAGNEPRTTLSKTLYSVWASFVRIVDFGENAVAAGPRGVNYSVCDGFEPWVVSFSVWLGAWAVRECSPSHLCTYLELPSGTSLLSSLFERDNPTVNDTLQYPL